MQVERFGHHTPQKSHGSDAGKRSETQEQLKNIKTVSKQKAGKPKYKMKAQKTNKASNDQASKQHSGAGVEKHGWNTDSVFFTIFLVPI